MFASIASFVTKSIPNRIIGDFSKASHSFTAEVTREMKTLGSTCKFRVFEA